MIVGEARGISQTVRHIAARDFPLGINRLPKPPRSLGWPQHRRATDHCAQRERQVWIEPSIRKSSPSGNRRGTDVKHAGVLSAVVF